MENKTERVFHNVLKLNCSFSNQLYCWQTVLCPEISTFAKPFDKTRFFEKEFLPISNKTEQNAHTNNSALYRTIQRNHSKKTQQLHYIVHFTALFIVFLNNSIIFALNNAL